MATNESAVGLLFKLRGIPNATEGLNISLGLEAWAVMADTHEEAREQGIAKALELWPATEGWFGHTVTAAAIHMQSDFPTINNWEGMTERIM